MISELRNPVFLCALAVLLINDWVLKARIPGMLTGKLSDVAGLFAFAFFVSTLCAARRRAWALCGIAVAFAWWKSPYAQPALDAWNALGILPWSRVVDPTDLLAIPVLLFVPPALAMRFTVATPLRRAPIAPIAIAAFVATSYAPVELSYEPGTWEYAVSDSQRTEVLRRARERGWLLPTARTSNDYRFDLDLRRRDGTSCGTVAVQFARRDAATVMTVHAVAIEVRCVGEVGPVAVRQEIERAFLAPLLTGGEGWPP